MTRSYPNPESFRHGLQARLKALAAERDISVQDCQLKFLIERLIARLFYEIKPPWILKGGFAMDLRYRPQARTTRDVDLTVEASGDTALSERLELVHEQMQEVAALDLGDYLEFRIAAHNKKLSGAPLGGASFPVEALLAGKVFGRFHIDVGFGDAVIGEPEELLGDTMLAFAGLAPARALVVPKAQQFAEKLHAYTYQWKDRENTRVKDLVDLVLLIERADLTVNETCHAIGATFACRNTHPFRPSLPAPPASWATEFPAMANQAGLTMEDLGTAFERLSGFVSELNLP